MGTHPTAGGGGEKHRVDREPDRMAFRNSAPGPQARMHLKWGPGQGRSKPPLLLTTTATMHGGCVGSVQVPPSHQRAQEVGLLQPLSEEAPEVQRS